MPMSRPENDPASASPVLTKPWHPYRHKMGENRQSGNQKGLALTHHQRFFCPLVRVLFGHEACSMFESSCPRIAVRRTASLCSSYVAGIHVLNLAQTKSWMAGTSPAIASERFKLIML
jgi:hypothetical protein